MISVSNLGKSFGSQTLFSGASMQFNPESRYGLVGANGSGKSTFLKILAGEESASDGQISIPKRRASASCARTTSATRRRPSSTWR